MNEKELIDSFLKQLGEDQARIEALWGSLRAADWDVEKSTLLFHAIHRLAGAALTIGYSDIGNAAQRLEIALRDVKAGPDWETLQTRFHDLKIAIADCKADKVNSQQIAQSNRIFFHSQDANSNGMIYIVEDDLAQAENLAAQVSRFGYKVHIFTRIAEMRAGLREQIPTAILMDIVFPEGESTGIDESLKLRREFGEDLPIYFISVRDDVIARIQAIRAGGKGYFLKPVDINALMDDINKLTMSTDSQAYRVMIVDDSEIQAKTNALHLRKANIETLVLTQAEDILDQLKNFRPDLLLLDLYLPDYTGRELAQMIRQIKAYIILPIVYLSSETDREKQLSAVEQGADDFLTKPIRPDHLVSAVTSRIERYRQLQTLMVRDGLTGLYNHTTMREYLIQEVNRANRIDQPFSIAMIDIDFFKKVNDTHGHTTGDKVLRSLSLMLTRRLRRTDIIGRYGGEEFIIIFPNTTKETALALMNEMRESFAQIVHVTDGVEFHVTFSCGIAAFPEEKSPLALSEAADRAMYIAKRQGRNQVVMA